VKHDSLLLLTFLVAPSLSAQLKPVPAPSTADRANVERLERSLAHDSMEGRGTAMPGSTKAARFLASEMKKVGLVSAGDSGFFQRVPMFMPLPRPADTSVAMRGGNVPANGAGGGGPGGRAGVRVITAPRAPDPESCQPRDARGVSLYPGQKAAYDSLSRIYQARFARGDTIDSLPVGGRGRGGGGGRGGQTPATMRPTRLPSLADLDTVPLERRRNAVNVVGMIPGSDPVLKNEVVLVLSHYDHLGMRTPAVPGGDSVYNGADDDAAGTVAVLEIARLLKKAGSPRRTLVFANMTGEEVGLIGTNWFIAHPAFPLTQIVAGFEIEMIGRPDSLAGGPGKAWLTGYERSTMGDMLKQYGIAIVPDIRPTQSFFTRSDNIGLARRGIVAHTLSTFNLHTDYHQLSDDVDKIDFDHMTAVIHSGAEAVRHLADGPKPEWHPGCSPQAAQQGGRGAGGR
jgi:Peptidase family M28